MRGRLLDVTRTVTVRAAKETRRGVRSSRPPCHVYLGLILFYIPDSPTCDDSPTYPQPPGLTRKLEHRLSSSASFASRLVWSHARASHSSTRRGMPLAMFPFTHGFVGRTSTAVDSEVVWACASYDNASSSTTTRLEKTCLEVIQKHATDPAGLYEMPLPDTQRVVTLIKTPAYIPRVQPLHDPTPLPSARAKVLSSERPTLVPPRVVFGVVVPIPTAGGPSAQDCAAWLDALASAFERRYGGVADVLERERELKLGSFGKLIKQNSGYMHPAAAAEKNPSRTATSAEADAMHSTRAKMDLVRITMVDNIARVVERGERLDDVLTKSDGLRVTADGFRRTASRLKNKMYWANVRALCFVVGVSLVAIVLVFLAACGGTACVQ